VEFELIADGRAAGRDVATERDVDLVEHVVVEVELVWPDTRLLVRIYAKPQDEVLRRVCVVLVDERVYVGRVGRRIADDQGRVHVAGRKQRAARERQRGNRRPRTQCFG